MKKAFKLADQAAPGRKTRVASPGFTLAEVLITLGVIGIVAALTMPALIANYQKKVFETRIKKFYSVMNQAVGMKRADDDALDFSMMTASNNAVQAEEFFNVNFAPYLKTTNVKKANTGIVVGFPDGAGVHMAYRTGDNAMYFNWCVDYKICNTADGSGPIQNSKQVILFHISKNAQNFSQDYGGGCNDAFTEFGYGEEFRECVKKQLCNTKQERLLGASAP